MMVIAKSLPHIKIEEDLKNGIDTFDVLLKEKKMQIKQGKE